MLDINHILESIVGLTTASILVKLLDKLIEKMCEHHDCRKLKEQEYDFISSHYNPNHVMFPQR